MITWQDGECRFRKSEVGATDTGLVEIEMFSETDLQEAVATVGPISVGLDASRLSFQFYRCGELFALTLSQPEDLYCYSEALFPSISFQFYICRELFALN